MNQASAEEILKEIAIDGELLHFESLAGGISAQTFRLDYSVARQTHSVVVSVHSDVDWQRNPNLAADEFEVLTFLRANGYPVASPLYVGTDSGIFDRPYLVVEHLGGRVIDGDALIPRLPVMAAQLAKLHAIPLTDWPLPDYPPPRQRIQPESTIDERMQESAIREALDGYVLRQENTPCLLHCDYWSGNLLWDDDGLVAVLDWEDFGVGDPMADVGNARAELAMQVDLSAVDAFTKRYLEYTSVEARDLPYWDLVSALFFSNRFTEFADDTGHETLLYQRMNQFVDQALARLS